jgi:hypothetical protein
MTTAAAPENLQICTREMLSALRERLAGFGLALHAPSTYQDSDQSRRLPVKEWSACAQRRC